MRHRSGLLPGTLYIIVAIIPPARVSRIVRFNSAVASALAYVWLLRNWSAANSKMHDAVHTKEGKPVDVARFTALRALWITKHNVHLVTFSDKAVSEMWTEGA